MIRPPFPMTQAEIDGTLRHMSQPLGHPDGSQSSARRRILSTTTTGSALSPDGQWLWDGAQWQAVLSADRRSRWNGFEWVPVRRPPSTYDRGPKQLGAAGLPPRKNAPAVISMITGIAALVFVLGYGVEFGWWFSGQIAQQSVGFGVVALIPAGGIGFLLGVVASVTASVGLKRISRSGGTGGRPFAEAGLAHRGVCSGPGLHTPGPRGPGHGG